MQQKIDKPNYCGWFDKIKLETLIYRSSLKDSMEVLTMGLFDKLLGREENQPEEKALSEKPKAGLPQDISDIEMAIAEKAAHLNEYKKIPLGEITTLGGVFAHLSLALRTVAQTVSIDGFGYMPINNLGGEALRQFAKNTPGIYAGSFKSLATGKATLAKWVKLGPQTVTANSIMPINPMMMAMAVMMVQVNQKLDAIQKTQQDILSFLQADKKAKLQGDLNMLSDILDKYKFNWDNDQYRSNYHMKALDIKQSAEQNIIFYQKQIADKIKGLPPVFLNQAIRDTMNKIADNFHDYSMALYLFSFSSYLEVMLLGNFSDEYLKSVAQRVKDYQAYYQDQFEKCRDYIAKVSGDSVQMKVQDAVGQAGKFLGNLIGSSPLLNRSPVDEWLKDGGEQLLKGKEERIAKLVSEFETKQETGSELFVDSIRNVKTVCNEIQAVMFDKENLYLIT